MKLMWTLLFISSLNTYALEVDIHQLDSLSKNGQQVITTWIDQSIKKTENTLGPLKQTTLPIYLKPQYFAFEPVP